MPGKESVFTASELKIKTTTKGLGNLGPIVIKI